MVCTGATGTTWKATAHWNSSAAHIQMCRSRYVFMDSPQRRISVSAMNVLCHRDIPVDVRLQIRGAGHWQVTFASLDCTAKSVSFAHASAPQMTWEPLGSMALRSHGDSRLQHVIKLGAHTQIQRYLRITLVGLLQTPGSGAVPSATPTPPAS